MALVWGTDAREVKYVWRVWALGLAIVETREESRLVREAVRRIVAWMARYACLVTLEIVVAEARCNRIWAVPNGIEPALVVVRRNQWMFWRWATGR